ncbi:MAG: hypothetical protein ACRCYE_01325, partial [Sarcina sp.]
KITVNGKEVSSVPTTVGNKDNHVVIIVEPKGGEGNTPETSKPNNKPGNKIDQNSNKNILGNPNATSSTIVNSTNISSNKNEGTTKVITQNIPIAENNFNNGNKNETTKITSLPDTGLSSVQDAKIKDLGIDLGAFLGLNILLGFLRKNKK